MTLATLQPRQAEDVRIPFSPSRFLSLGVEVEVQLVDWKTMELCPGAPRLLKALGQESGRFRPELFQSMLEFATGVCSDMEEVETDLRDSCRKLHFAAEESGIEIVGVGTHPLDGAHRDSVVYPSDRYRMLVQHRKSISTGLSIYGLHVHVGARSGNHATALINGVVPYLPHLLALSASSPYSSGKDTGLASSRATVFERLPTAGTAPSFRTWAEFENLVACLKRSHSITSLKDLWWDIRPNPTFGTVEVRVCDGLRNLEDTLAVVTAIQCLFAWVDNRLSTGEEIPPIAPWRMRENKWRAARWGLEAEMVVDDLGATRPLRDEWELLMGVFGPIADSLGSRPYLTRLRAMLERTPSYTRQREIFREYSSLQTVVYSLAEEWKEGLA